MAHKAAYRTASSLKSAARRLLAAAVLATTAWGTPGLGQVCEELPATTLASWIADHKMLSFSIGSTLNTAWKAYLKSPGDKALENVLFELGMGGAGMSVPGLGILIKTGRVYVGGAEWTVEEAQHLQLDAFLCGGVSGGERLPGLGFFQTGGAQAISPGITCENFGDRITSFEQFQRIESAFQGFYRRSILELGGRQNRQGYSRILDEQWKTIERTWKARTGARLLDQLRADLKRLAEDVAGQPCAPAVQAAAKPGEDVSDPSALPTPPIPPEGGFVLLRVDVVTQPNAPDNVITAGPQKAVFKAPYGELVCAWTSPPKLAAAEFDIAIEVTSRPAEGQDLQGYIVARSGFRFISGTVNELSGTANEAYANGTDGVPGSGSASMRLAPPELAGATPGSLLHFSVGGCGANVDYIYEFRR